VNKQHILLVGVVVLTIMMILTFLFGFNTPEMERFATWKQTPKVLVCKHQKEYLDKSIFFWEDHGNRFGEVQESWYCPEFLDGYIIVSVSKNLGSGVLGKTILPLYTTDTISTAHVYVKSISYKKRDQITLAHELGHAIGYPHTKTNVPRHIMNPNPRRQRWIFKD